MQMEMPAGLAAKMVSRCRFSVAILQVSIVALLSLKAGSQTLDAPSSDNSLVVLALATDEVGRQREDELVAELRLLLDGVTVEEVVGEPLVFVDAPVSQQVERIAQNKNASTLKAAVWLAQHPRGTVALHVLSLETGTKLNEPILLENDVKTIAEFALITHELLREHGLIEETIPPEEDPPVESPEVDQPPAPAAQKPIKEDVSTSTKSLVVPWRLSTCSPTPRHAEGFAATMSALGCTLGNSHNWQIGVMAVSSGGIYDHRSGSFRVGGGLMAQFWPRWDLFFRLSLAIGAGPLAEELGIELTGWWFSPRLEVGYAIHRGPLYFGPVFALGFPRTRTWFSFPNDYSRETSWWSLRTAVGGELGWQVSSFVHLVLNATVGVQFPQENYLIYYDDPESQGEVLSLTFQSPRIDWNAMLGFNISTYVFKTFLTQQYRTAK